MKNQVQELISKGRLFSREETLLVSFSGGPDSVALVLLLRSLGYTRLRLVYFSHGIRCESASQTELAFVRNFAAQYGTFLWIKKIPVRFVSREYSQSLEASGHFLRRHVLQHYAALWQCSVIVTGHHADDVEEQCLMQLVRGHVFYSGLSVHSKVGDIPVVRPLLECKKGGLLAYLDGEKQGYCVDESNQDVSFTRNKVRHELLPLLRSLNPKFSLFMSANFERLNKAFQLGVNEELCVVEHGGYFSCDLEAVWGRLSDVDLGMLIMKMIRRVYGCRVSSQGLSGLKGILAEHVDVSYERVLDVIQVLRGGLSGELSTFPGGCRVFYSGKSLYFLFDSVSIKGQAVKLGESVSWAGYRVSIQECDARDISVTSTKNTCFLASESSLFGVRFLTESERFTAFNRSSKESVMRYLSKQGLSYCERLFLPCITVDDQVAWLPSFTIDHRFKVCDFSQPVYKVSLDPLTAPVTHVIS